MFCTTICECDLSNWQKIDADVEKSTWCESPDEWVCDFVELFRIQNRLSENVSQTSEGTIQIL